jgi:hypothetical protein
VVIPHPPALLKVRPGDIMMVSYAAILKREKRKMAKKPASIDPAAGMAARAVDDPEYIDELIEGLSAPGSSKLRCAKALNLLSASHPALLYPHFEFFGRLLDSDHKILKWNAIMILGNLTGVDADRRFDAIFDKYYRHLWDGDLITAANVIGASGTIARARPDLSGRVTTEILKIDVIPLPTEECRQIVRGKAVTTLSEYIPAVRQNASVNDFVLKCLDSRRPATRKKAEAWLDGKSRRAQ